MFDSLALLNHLRVTVVDHFLHELLDGVFPGPISNSSGLRSSRLLPFQVVLIARFHRLLIPLDLLLLAQLGDLKLEKLPTRCKLHHDRRSWCVGTRVGAPG